MNADTIIVLDPVAKSASKEIPAAKRLAELKGKTIGILWNSKPNGDILFESIGELMTQRYHISNIIWRRKSGADIPGTEFINELAEEADAVICGQGD